MLLLIQPGVAATVVTQLSSPCCPGGGGTGGRIGWRWTGGPGVVAVALGEDARLDQQLLSPRQ